MAKIYPYLTEISVEGPPQGKWTFADWEKLSHINEQYEVIDSLLYLNPWPSTFHQWIIQQLYIAVGYQAEEQKLAYAAASRVAVIMDSCTPVQPDFSIIMAERTSILKRYVWGVPDFIAEVLSPKTDDYHFGVKLEAYAKAGLPEFAIIDPMKRQLSLYHLKSHGQFTSPQAFNESDTLALKCLPMFPITVSDLFDGAPDTTP